MKSNRHPLHKRIIGALFSVGHPEILAPEPQGIHARAEDVLIQDTEPLEREVRIGARLRREDNHGLSDLIVSAIDELINNKDQSRRLTFHFDDGVHFDVRIYRPYRIRKYKGDCIVQVAVEPNEVK